MSANIAESENALRIELASRYLKGNGIEIGALHSPLKIPVEAKVQYLDRMSAAKLKQTYPELAECELVEVDIIDDGETVSSILDNSLDFIIANHMIEHCQNPIFSIENWLRVLKPGGTLYIAVPDKRYTFDYDRPVTSLEHLVRDYTEGTKWSRDSHFEEWARLVDKYPEPEIAARAKGLAELNYSIHFHVWTQLEFLELIIYCRNYLAFTLEIEVLQKNGREFVAILSKTGIGKERSLSHVQQYQLQRSDSKLEQLQSLLQHTQVELQQTQVKIQAMQTSKFWKLRTAWFNFKKSMGLLNTI